MLKTRLISDKDYPNIINLLSNLANIEISKIQYLEYINNLASNHQIWGLYKDDNLVASGSIFIETKLIHNLGKVGHIEDIVVDTSERRQGFASKILNHLIDIAKREGCYKTILNCSNEVVSLYEKNAFKCSGNLMSIYF